MTSESIGDSNSTFGESQSGTSYDNSLTPPPPRRHMTGPDKLSPSEQYSGASSEDDEAALDTSEVAICQREDSGLSHQGLGQDREEDRTVYEPNTHLKRKKKRNNLRLQVENGARDVPAIVLSPQAKSSYKVHQLTGLEDVPRFRETSPTGHNSEKKLRELTGLEFTFGISARRCQAEYGEPNGDGDDAAVDQQDSPGGSHLDRFHAHNSVPALSIPQSTSGPPRRPSRRPERPGSWSPRHSNMSREFTRSPLSPCFDRLSHISSESGPDPYLYHEAARELARQDPLAAQQSKPDPTMRLVSEMLLRPINLNINTSQEITRSPALPPKNPAHHRLFQRPGTRTPETDRSIPISISMSSDIGATVTAGTGLSDEATSPRRSNGRRSSLMARVFRWSSSSTPSSPPRPTGGGSGSTSSAQMPFNTPVSPSRPQGAFSDHAMIVSDSHRHLHHHHGFLHPYHDRRNIMIHHYPLPNSSAAQTSSTPNEQDQQHQQRPPPQNNNKPTKPSGGGSELTALASKTAAKTTELATAAVAFLNRSAASLASAAANAAAGGEERRRRKQLKSSIRVLGDGRRVTGSDDPSVLLSPIVMTPPPSSPVVGGGVGVEVESFWAGREGDGSVWGNAVVLSPDGNVKGGPGVVAPRTAWNGSGMTGGGERRRSSKL
ncbi:hypothetical protein VTJ04DRAFT_1699 [Mycothermus thermophilus]|uniref:uncharacterized protein n=1 Tax=Humicola insolens TaxID=85995 RepID=UPI003743E980